MKRLNYSTKDIVNWSFNSFPTNTPDDMRSILEEDIRKSNAMIGKSLSDWYENMASVSIISTILEGRFKSKTASMINKYIDGLPERAFIMEARDRKMDINKQKDEEMIKKLLERIKGSPSPKPIGKEPKYDMRTEVVYSYELNLLRTAAYQKGKRQEALKKIKEFMAWRLANREE